VSGLVRAGSAEPCPKCDGVSIDFKRNQECHTVDAPVRAGVVEGRKVECMRARWARVEVRRRRE
jgi:hypothetical protein